MLEFQKICINPSAVKCKGSLSTDRLNVLAIYMYMYTADSVLFYIYTVWLLFLLHVHHNSFISSFAAAICLHALSVPREYGFVQL